MVLIDYSKRRSDATPIGDNSVTREIPRRHHGDSIATTTTSRSRGNSLGSYGDIGGTNNANTGRSRSKSPINTITAAATRIAGARARSGSHYSIGSQSQSPTPPRGLLSRNRSEGSTNSRSTSPHRRQLVVPPIKPISPPDDIGPGGGGGGVDDWIDAIVDTRRSSSNLHQSGSGDHDRRISGLSIGSFGSMSGTSLHSRSSGFLSVGATSSDDINDSHHQDKDDNKPKKNFSFTISKNTNKRCLTTGDIFTSGGGGGEKPKNNFPFLSKNKSSGASVGGGSRTGGGGGNNDLMSSWISGGDKKNASPTSEGLNRIGGGGGNNNSNNNDWMSAWATGGGGNQKNDTSTDGGGNKSKNNNKKDWMSLWATTGGEGGNQNITTTTKESAAGKKLMAAVNGDNGEVPANATGPLSRKEGQKSSSGSLMDSSTSSAISAGGGAGGKRRISRKERQVSSGSHTMDGSTASRNSVTSSRRRVSNNSLQMDGSAHSSMGGGSNRRISRKDRLSIVSNSSSHSQQDYLSDHSSQSPVRSRKDRIITRTTSDDNNSENNMTATEVSTLLKDDSLGQSSTTNRTDEMNESSSRNEISSLRSFKPSIQTSSRTNRVMRRPRGGGGGGAAADEAMPTAGMNPNRMMKSKKPNPFKRCNTSDLVKEHRNRRPTVLVEMEFGDDEEGLDMSGSSEHSDDDDADFLNAIESNTKKGSSRIKRSVTAPEELRVAAVTHDWSKPSVQTVDWSKPTTATTEDDIPKLAMPKLNRSFSDGVHRSGTYPVPLPSNNTTTSTGTRDDMNIPKPRLKQSLSMCNVFVQKPVLEKSISFTIRRRKKEGGGAPDTILDATNSTFAKLSESLVNAVGTDAASAGGTIPANLESNLAAPLTLQRMTSLSTMGAPKPNLSRSISTGGAELSSAVGISMLKRSTSGGASDIMSHKLKRSVSSGAPTSVMGTKSRRNLVGGMDLSAPSSNGYVGRRGAGEGGMDGSAPALSGYVGRRSVSPASKGSLMDDRSGSSLSLSPTRKPKRATSAFGFGVPDNKFGYEQRTEEARQRGRSPGPRKPTLDRATSLSGVGSRTSGGYNHMHLGSPKRRPSSSSPSMLQGTDGNQNPSSPTTSRPSPGRIRRPSPPNRAGSGSPTSQRPSSLKRRGSMSRITVLDSGTDPGTQQFDNLPKPGRLSRYASHGDIDHGVSSQCKRGSLRRSTSFTQAMTSFKGVKRRPSIASPAEPVREEPLFKGVKRRPASLSAEGKRQSGVRECSPKSPTRSKSGETLHKLMAGLKGPLTPRTRNKRKKSPPSTSNAIHPTPLSGQGDDSRSSTKTPLGANNGDSGDMKDLDSKRDYGKSDPTEAGVGFGDDGSGNGDIPSDIYGKSRTAASAGRQENRRQLGRSNSMNQCKATYGFQDESGRRTGSRGSIDQLLTSASHHSQLQNSQTDDDLCSVTSFSSHSSRRSRAKGSRQRKNLSRDIDSSGFVTGSRIRRIEKGKSVGLAK